MKTSMDKLDKAIQLHREHMKNPSTATPASQEELMLLLNDHKKEMVVPRKSPDALIARRPVPTPG